MTTLDAIMCLVTDYANASHDCGNWRDGDDDIPYAAVYAVAQQAREALIAALRESLEGEPK